MNNIKGSAVESVSNYLNQHLIKDAAALLEGGSFLHLLQTLFSSQGTILDRLLAIRSCLDQPQIIEIVDNVLDIIPQEMLTCKDVLERFLDLLYNGILAELESIIDEVDQIPLKIFKVELNFRYSSLRLSRFRLALEQLYVGLSYVHFMDFWKIDLFGQEQRSSSYVVPSLTIKEKLLYKSALRFCCSNTFQGMPAGKEISKQNSTCLSFAGRGNNMLQFYSIIQTVIELQQHGVLTVAMIYDRFKGLFTCLQKIDLEAPVKLALIKSITGSISQLMRCVRYDYIIALNGLDNIGTAEFETLEMSAPELMYCIVAMEGTNNNGRTTIP